ncbi:MAG: acetolactate synthase small subunit [Verrucomicrobiales bacterium]|nr:acetolactate synthase small subunit [Verrucomicrobiales bacterium]
MQHTISILVENKFGVLTRVAGLFSGRGYNIDTLNVGPTQTPEFSRMTIVTHGDDSTLEQIVKQLNKLPNVIKVQNFRDDEYVDRELVLVKVNVDSKSRAEVMQITDIFRAKIVDVQPKTLTIEITGNGSKVEKFLDLMKTFGVLELTRTGQVAMPRK